MKVIVSIDNSPEARIGRIIKDIINAERLRYKVDDIEPDGQEYGTVIETDEPIEDLIKIKCKIVHTTTGKNIEFTIDEFELTDETKKKIEVAVKEYLDKEDVIANVNICK